MKRILVAHKAADGSLVDVETQFKGTATRPILMLGSGGAERERAILATLPGKAELSARGSLPVLLGGGLGMRSVNCLIARPTIFLWRLWTRKTISLR